MDVEIDKNGDTMMDMAKEGSKYEDRKDALRLTVLPQHSLTIRK